MPYLNIPVVNDKMIAQWKRDCHQIATRVRLGNNPEIIGPDPIGSYDVRIWRRRLPRDVVAFTDRVLALGEGYIDAHIRGFFRTNKVIAARDGQLYRSDLDGCNYNRGPSLSETPLHATDLANKLSHPAIDQSLVWAFSSYFTSSLEAVLSQTPTKVMKHELVMSSYEAKIRGECHVDEVSNLLFHFTDPGTRYPTHLTRPDATRFTWRVKAGDINWHGPKASHGLAAKRPDANGHAPRLCISFVDVS